MKYAYFYCLFLALFVLNSCREPVDPIKEQCASYTYSYNSLVDYVNYLKDNNLIDSAVANKHSHNSYSDAGYGRIIDSEAVFYVEKNKIEEEIKYLDSSKCDQKKSLTFAHDVVKKIQDWKYEIFASRQRIANDDAMVEFLITDEKLVYDENLNPFIKLSISNNTNIPVTSFSIIVTYCQSHFDENQENCFDEILLKSGPVGHSSKDFSFKLSKDKIVNDRKPNFYIYKILQSNGKLIKRYLN